MRTLTGHTRDVRAVAYTPDGRPVSGGGDKTVRIWDPATGECARTVRAQAPVYAVAVSPAAGTIAYAGRIAPGVRNNFISLLDPTGEPAGVHKIRRLFTVERNEPARGLFELAQEPTARTIWALTFSADGRYLAASCRVQGGGNFLNGAGGWLLDPARSDDARAIPGHDIYTTSFAPAGRTLGITCLSAVEFRDDPWEAVRTRYPTPTNYAPAVAFFPGADLAVVASGSFLLFVNPVRQEKPARVKTGVRAVSALAVSPDGRTLLAGGRPETVEVYDTATRTRTTTYDFGIGGLHALAFAPDGLTFAAAGDKGLVVCDAPG